MSEDEKPKKPNRTIGASTFKKPPSRAIDPEGSSEKHRFELGPRVRVEQLFLVCLLGGLTIASLGLFIGGEIGRAITLTSPVVATIAYPIIGIILGYQRYPSLRERFADNCYYLGFIFTQGGLMFAFLPATLFGEEITSSQVIQFFGMAIGAALSGLIARTILIQSSTSITDLGDQMHGEVEQLARQLATESRKVIAQFEKIADGVGRVPEQFATRIEGRLNEMDAALARLKVSLETIADDYDASRKIMSDATEQTRLQSQRSLSSLEGAVRQSAASIQSFGVEIETENRAAIEALRTTSTTLAASLAAFEGLGQLTGKLPDLEREVTHLKAASEDARNAATNLSENLNSAIKQVERDIAGAVQNGVGSIDKTTSTSVEALDRAATATVSDISQKAEKFRSDLEVATASFGTILDAFNKRLDELRPSGSHDDG